MLSLFSCLISSSLVLSGFVWNWKGLNKLQRWGQYLVLWGHHDLVISLSLSSCECLYHIWRHSFRGLQRYSAQGDKTALSPLTFDPTSWISSSFSSSWYMYAFVNLAKSYSNIQLLRIYTVVNFPYMWVHVCFSSYLMCVKLLFNFFHVVRHLILDL